LQQLRERLVALATLQVAGVGDAGHDQQADDEEEGEFHRGAR